MSLPSRKNKLGLKIMSLFSADGDTVFIYPEKWPKKNSFKKWNNVHKWIILILQQRIHLLTQKNKTTCTVFACLPSHIGIKGNKQIDAFANVSPDLKVPYTDSTIKSATKKSVCSTWGSSQPGNTLFLKWSPMLRPYVPKDLRRRDEVVFNRLKIGDSFRTHKSYWTAGTNLFA